MNKKLFQGSGGGGPKTTPDSLLSEDIVEFALAISEGPIRGLSNGAYSFYVGDTALVGQTGTRNFDKFAIGVHPGYPEGAAKALELKLGGVSSNVNVGTTLQQNVAVTRQTPGQLRKHINVLEVRLQFSQLVTVDSKGGTNVNTARFKIEAKPANGSNWVMFNSNPVSSGTVSSNWIQAAVDKALAASGANVPAPGELTITGKTTGGYVREFKLEVPLIDDDWVIRVTKLSKDNDEHDVVAMGWESYQATSTEKVAYPNTAIVHGLGVANAQFASIPDFSGIYDGLVIRVPSNYNPDTRTYDESVPWNGAFKFAWTNNPAWILYDLIVNERYGLAKHRRYIDANRFSFYQAAKWCDQPVAIADSTETRPRYTFNMVLNEARGGMEMLNYVAGSFNALVWDDLQGQIHLRIDKDEPAVMLFGPENITDEGFAYSFTDLASRANDFSVSFINPDLDWNEDHRRIPNITTNEEHIEKYGRVPMDYIAVGCTNLHEAISKSQVRLISSLTETTSVSFTTTRQGALLSLFDTILVADPDMGWSQSGRLTTYDDTWINFRDPLYIETMDTYVVKLQTVDGVYEVNVVPESIGHVNRLRLQGELPVYLPTNTVFTIEGQSSSFGYAKPFKVLSISEVDGSPYLYAVTAIEINRNKYIQAEGDPTNVGKDFDYSVKYPYLPAQPTNFTAVSGDEQIQIMPTGEVIARILASWRKPLTLAVKSYVLQYRLLTDGDTNWQTINTTGTTAYISPVVPDQHYTLRLATIDGDNRQSEWVTIADHLAKGKSKIPNGIQLLTAKGEVFQITLKWSFVTPIAPDLTKVEIWVATAEDRSAATKLTDLAYPTTSWVHVGLNLDVTLYYWIRVQDSTGNYSAWSNVAKGTTSKDPTQILGILEGRITTSQLYTDLGKRIDLIDAPATTIGSVAARILDEAKARDQAIVSLKTLTDSADSNLAQTLNAVATKTDQNTSAIQSEVTARTTAISAESTARNEQFTAFGSTIRSEYQNYSYSKSTSDSTTTQVYTTLRSEYSTAANNAVRDAQAYVQSYAYTKAQSDSSAASYANQVTARLNNIGGTTIEQAFSSTANSISGLYSQYTVKIDSGGRVVGFGLASKVSNDGTADSSFIVRADNFAIAYPGVDSKVPFMVGNVNGQSVVGINGALVIDGTLRVKSANIDDASIDTLKVAGGAITGLTVAYGSGSIPASGSTVILYAGLGMPSGSTGAVITGTASVYCADSASITMTIYKNGGAIGSAGVSVQGGFHAAATYSALDYSPAGYNTYSLGFSNPSSGPGSGKNVTVESCSIIVSGAKR